MENSIIKLKNLELVTEQIQKQYKEFLLSLDSIYHLLTISPAINKLFDSQFVDSGLVKTLIVKIIKSRLPDFGGNMENINNSFLVKSDFLRDNVNKMEVLYSGLVDKIKKVNEYIPTDSFENSNGLKADLLSKSKNKATLEMGKITIKINKDPLFKEQLEFITSKINQFRNQNFRDSIFIYTDTVFIRILRLYNHNFQQTIKSFQANTDEIKIHLPYQTSEPFVIKTKYRFKVDGSTGIFAHFLGGDEKYKVVPAEQLDGADSLQVIRQRTDPMTVSLGFLINAYIYNPSKLFNPALSLGVNFPINNNQSGTGFSQLVGGISFISTTVDRMSFTIGISLRKGQVLNTNNLTSIEAKEKYTFNNKNVIEPTFDIVTKPGIFFGFSYALFGGKKTSSTE